MYGEFVSAVCYIRFINAWAETPRLRATRVTGACCVLIFTIFTMFIPDMYRHALPPLRAPRDLCHEVRERRLRALVSAPASLGKG